MTLGFVFDTKFRKCGDDYYSTNLSADLLVQRYLTVFDDMVVVGRYLETEEKLTEKFVKSNDNNIRFECIPNEHPLKRILHFKKENRHIMSTLSQCDAVICRGWRGVRICQKLKKPYLIEVVNCAWDSYWNHGLLGKFVAPIMFMIRRITTKNAPYVIYVTNEFLQKRYPTTGRSVCISNVALSGFDTAILETRKEKILSKSKGDKIIVGTAAAVDVPFKGQRFVIRALAKLKAVGKANFEYQIVGKGNNEKLKKLAEKLGVLDQVVFVGSMVHDKIFAWYDTLDIYVQPSLQEGLPRAMIEAMSRGLPCYGTKTGGIPELIDKSCVCSSNCFIPKKFARFLESYEKNKALKIAERNYYESQKYAADILEERRYKFLTDFSNGAKGV